MRAIEIEGGKWVRDVERRFHNLVDAHVVAEGYEPRGLVWRLICERIWDGATTTR